MSEWCWYYEGDDWVRREIKLGYELSDPIPNPFAPLGLSLHPRTGEPAEPNPLPDNPMDYCVTCDGIHDPARHTRLANMHLNKCRTTDE